MQITRHQLDEVLAHAQRDVPNECCGVLAMSAGVVLAVHEMENLAASPMRFEIDGAPLSRLMFALEDDGAEVGSIYHSHPRSEAYPSQTDINFAAQWPGVEWLIVGLRGVEPEARSYLITPTGEVTEVAVEVT